MIAYMIKMLVINCSKMSMIWPCMLGWFLRSHLAAAADHSPGDSSMNPGGSFLEKEYDIVYQEGPTFTDTSESVARNSSAAFHGLCGPSACETHLEAVKETLTDSFYANVSDPSSHGLGSMGQQSVHYSPVFAAAAATLSTIIFTFGILGNIFVVAVIARSRKMHTPTNCYLLSLAVADSLVLVSATLPSIPEPFYRVDEWPYGRVMCSLLIFVQYLGVDCSSLSITAFTIERYIAICHPMKAQLICTVSRAKRIIIALWVVMILYCSPWLGLTDITEIPIPKDKPLQKCKFRLARSSYITFYMIDLVLLYVIPLIVASVLYLLIGRILYISRALRTSGKTTRQTTSSKLVGQMSDSRVQVVRMLVVVVVLFAALWMPYRVVVVYNSFAQNKFFDLWFLLFARTMLYVNSAINPILYGVMSVRFRRAFQSYLRCCRKHSTPTRNSSSQTATEEVGIRRTILSYIRKSGRRQGSGRASSCSAYVAKQFLEAKSPLEVTRSSVRSRDYRASSCCAEKTV